RHPVTVGEPSTKALSRTVVIEEAIPEGDKIVRLTLRDTRGVSLPKWSPGAHIDVDCGLDAAGEPISRQYSLCGPAGTDTYQIAVLDEDDSRGGSRWIHANATAGSTLRIRGPRNHFRLDDDATELILIAGGI